MAAIAPRKILRCYVVITLAMFGQNHDVIKWRNIVPVLTSQSRSLRVEEARELLAGVCDTPPRAQSQKSHVLTCPLRPSEVDYGFGSGETFEAIAVNYGHFLSASSVDAMISGSSMETHPALWEGTLLVSKRGGKWVPIWYKSGIGTRACEKVALPSGREVPLCEGEDSGMGAVHHFIYSVDALSPVSPIEQSLVHALSRQGMCDVVQRENIQAAVWEFDRGQKSLVLAMSSGRIVLSEEERRQCEISQKVPAIKMIMRHIRFRVTDRGLSKY